MSEPLAGGREPSTSVTVLEVPDMDCASCARRISDRLERLDGVESVSPRVLSRDVHVKYDAKRVGEEAIATAIRKLGFDIERAGVGREPGAVRDARVWMRSDARRAYVSGALLAVALLLRAIDLGGLGPPGAWLPDAGSIVLILAALVGGYNFFPKGLRAARNLELDMNFLMTAAIFGALAIGEFVEAASIAFLFSLAELLERHAVERARGSIEELLRIVPATARVRRGEDEALIPVEEVEPGDIVLIRPGEKVAIDGEVRTGISAVDQSSITGESMPVTKSVSDPVYAGSLNCDGYLEVEASKRAGDTTLAHIIRMVEEAEALKAPSERFVERFARYYTPVVTGLALTVMVVPPLFMDAPFATWFVRGLTLLVISCPCALVISTPVAVVSALTAAARHGVLIKGGVHLEALASVRAVAFDKTGTLTAGQLEVVRVVPAPHGPSVEELVSIAAAVESGSEHPIAEAIRLKAVALDQTGAFLKVSEFKALPGQGAQARLGGVPHLIGRPELFGAAAEPWRAEIARLATDGRTAVCVGNEREVLALLAVADREREHAQQAIRGLRQLGIKRIAMLTGDSESSARQVAEALGVDEWYAGLLPGEKVEVIRQIESEVGAVAMVGDGVNDAPALAAATVGIAMGAAGSDVALETADIALMGDDLSRLPYLFKLSRRAESVIRQNIVASIALKLSLAGGVLPGVVNLITAVLVGDLGASLAVTGNAFRLARIRD